MEGYTDSVEEEEVPSSIHVEGDILDLLMVDRKKVGGKAVTEREEYTAGIAYSVGSILATEEPA